MLGRTVHRYESYRERTKRGRRLRRVVLFILGLFLAYLIITFIFLMSVRQDSDSMMPTISAGDRLFVSPLLYGPRIRAFSWVLPGVSRPKRGDVVALRPGYLQAASGGERLANPIVRFVTVENVRLDDGEAWRSAYQVKRIVGLPGDTVRIERFVAYIRPEGESRFESEFQLSARRYEITAEPLPDGWRGDDPFGNALEEFTLGNDEYFVMGDHRNRSVDSRHWGIVNERDLHGRVIFRYWPLGVLGSISSP
jgi:signal peptidase I